MQKYRKVSISLFLVFFMFICTLYPVPCTLTYADVPHLINYQGRLTERDGKPITGSRQITFNIYDAQAAPAAIWTEIHSNILVEKGTFSVLLGSVNGNLPAFDKPYWLGIRVGNDEEMQPRQQITSVGYAIRAEKAEEAKKIKADNQDPEAGYLVDKIDNNTIKIDPATHKLYIASPHGSQLFTTNGTFTAPAGITAVYLTMCGGGGGGGATSDGNGTGGGGGASLIKFFYTVTPAAGLAVVVGAGGVGGISFGAAAGGGGATSFNTVITVPGGGGGYAANSTTVGVGAVGFLNGSGSTPRNGCLSGGDGGYYASAGGAGGSSYLGMGGTGGASGQGTVGSYGGGGGGSGYSINYNGGAGGAGMCLVEW